MPSGEGRRISGRYAGFYTVQGLTQRLSERIHNLNARKGEQGCELIEDGTRATLHLSPYPLELDPIEKAFAKVKAVLRKAEARTREAIG
jgi:transposase